MNISPNRFPFSYSYRGNEILTTDSTEAICQGGPTIFSLVINNNRVGKDLFFGGQILFHENYLLAPLLVYTLWKGHQFKLTAIELDTLFLNTISGSERMILLFEVKNGMVFFYTNLENTKVKKVKFPNNLTLSS